MRTTGLGRLRLFVDVIRLRWRIRVVSRECNRWRSMALDLTDDQERLRALLNDREHHDG